MAIVVIIFRTKACQVPFGSPYALLCPLAETADITKYSRHILQPSNPKTSPSIIMLKTGGTTFKWYIHDKAICQHDRGVMVALPGFEPGT